MDLEKIVAVVNCGQRKANEYLEHGYVLLRTGEWADEHDMKPKSDGTPRTFVAKGVTYMLGRTADIPAYNPAEHEPEG